MKRITVLSTIATIAALCGLILILGGEDCDNCYSAGVMAMKSVICGFLVIGLSIVFTQRYLKTERIIFDIENQPLLETNEVSDGVSFAGEGIVEQKESKILDAPYTNTPCVYFHSIKEAYVKSGKHSYWKVIENIALFVPFYLRDERGKLAIDLTNMDEDFSDYTMPFHAHGVPNPKNSEIDCDAILKHDIYTEESGIWSQRKYRRSEFVLKPETKVFAYGMVSRRNSELVLHEDLQNPLIISKKNRDKYIEEFYRGGNLVYWIHFMVALGFSIVVLAANYFFRWPYSAILGTLFIGNSIIAGTSVFSIYNRIITLKQRAFNALSNIEGELKRRTDLIPNLVEAVKKYSQYEKEMQQIIAEARVEIIFSKELLQEKSPVIPSLAAVIENYPDLKASELFQSLMQNLVDTEERVAYSREFYNRSIRKYNTLIEQFPFRIITWLTKTKKMDFISIGRGETS